MKYTLTAMLSTALLMFSGTSKAGIVPVAIEKPNAPVKKGVYKPILVMLGLATLFTAQTAHSAGSNMVQFEQWAQIVNVEAVWKHDTTTHNHCTKQNTSIQHSNDHNPSNEILGAIIGGVIGNKLGKGDTGATIVGAIGGGAIANKMEDGHTHNQTITVCEPHTTITKRRNVAYYIVTYSLNGKQFIVHEYQKPRHMEKKVTVKVQIIY